jgi:hypothetical protein
VSASPYSSEPTHPPHRLVKDIPINYELGIRVAALEELIRSGSTLDPEAAQSAALETVLHATRAANSGSLDAGQALAQLTQTANLGGGIQGMSQDAQSSLLMEVLQQVWPKHAKMEYLLRFLTATGGEFG